MKDIVIGIDLGGTNIKAGAVSPTGTILFHQSTPTNAAQGPEAVADRIAEAALQCRDGVPNGRQRTAGIGIGSPGTIDLGKGIVQFSPNLPGWTDIPLRDMVEKRTGLPCVLENDANAAALGEQWVGAGRGTSSVVIFTLGTGIGGGIVLDGKVWHGFNGVAAEIGHMSIDPHGPKCGCGNTGCIEAYASATAMVRRMKEAIASGQRTSLAARGDRLTAKDIYDAATAGDKAARENMQETGRYLGVAISNIMHILNPEVVVLSGGVTAAGDMLMRPILEEVDKRTLEASRRNVQVLFARLGDDAGVIGTARCFMMSARMPG